MNDFLKRILQIGVEIDQAENPVQIMMAADEATSLYESHLDELKLHKNLKRLDLLQSTKLANTKLRCRKLLKN